MPRPKGYKKAFANKAKDQKNGRFIKESITDASCSDDVTAAAKEGDWEGINMEELSERTVMSSNTTTSLVRDAENFGLFDDGSSTKRPRGFYTGTSEVTMWRRRKEAEAVNPKAKLENFGFYVTTSKENTPKMRGQKRVIKSEEELVRIRESFKQIATKTAPEMNKRVEGSHGLTYQLARYWSVKHYFVERLNGKSKGEALKSAASYYWPDNNKDYRAMTIIKWVKEFFETGEISEHSQGAHIKRQSFLSDSDVKLMVLEYIRKTRPAERSLVVIQQYIANEVIPAVLGCSPQLISKSTISRYLHEWGYSYRPNKKTVYFDGHEREDVVEYRNNWSKRMVGYMEKMDFFDEKDTTIVLEPILEEGEEKLVFVTHDECTFYANDGKNDIWLMEGESYIRKKSMGSSIMVSEFQCPCHGTMRIKNWKSRTLFKAGDSREGWWSYNNMVDQLTNDAIPLFESLHPGCKAIFLFDNSSNHGAYSSDALVASRMTLNKKPWPTNHQFQFKDTEVELSNGTTLKQSFYYDEVVKQTDRKGKSKEKTVRYFKGKKH